MKKTLDERISAILGAEDFMMMDVHRPMTDEEISSIHSQARLDKSLRAVPDVDRETPPVGEPHEEEPAEDRRYDGPFVKFPDKVHVLDVSTSHELDVDRVLQSAYDNKLSSALVIGWNEEGLWILCSEPAVAEAYLLAGLAQDFFLSAVKNRETAEDPRGPIKA